MTITEGKKSSPARRPLGRPVPAEGEDGLFTQSWYPVCVSSSVTPGNIYSTSFLGGRVVAVRAPDGSARVLSAYCPHVGADLAVGRMVDSEIRCAFHGWRYNHEGLCTATGNGDGVPNSARLFAFPTMEKHNIVYAFNGTEPFFSIPDFPYPDSELVYHSYILDKTLPVDPWVVMANTPDIAHMEQLHGFTTLSSGYDHVEFTEHSFSTRAHAILPTGQTIDWAVGIWGTTIFFQHGTIDGRWFGLSIPCGIPEIGSSNFFISLAVKPLEGETPEDTQNFIEYVHSVELLLASDDLPVWSTVHFRPGTLTRGDRVLSKFLESIRRWPRAHPSAEFIR